LFPPLLSEEAATDPLQRQQQFVRSWQAVRFRYRTCCEANEEFKSLYAAASQPFREWNSDEEHWYKVDAYTSSL
jgi:hypothetical protein